MIFSLPLLTSFSCLICTAPGSNHDCSTARGSTNGQGIRIPYASRDWCAVRKYIMPFLSFLFLVFFPLHIFPPFHPFCF
ncbi:hypothetical protein B9Z19DRAFT_673911 [Tuber borchii]|uniref:Secreted peptide n=1 Tax=Tuber borchii TaxID=42251 RepID=A0A2T6ZZQ8_TUBBO|nr:hypothetical protein B9Z19DRAFT_673911 [Tuber borchii]